MQKELLPLAEEYAKQNKRQSIWRKVVRVMACAVVFCTTYALILPAITMERPLCELEEHTHSDSCYVKLTTREVRNLTCSYETLEVHKHTEECRNEDQELICGYADFVVHAHNGSCYDAGGVQVCVLPEIKEHEHTEECYLVEEQEEHVHDDTCYRTELGDLICELPETEGHAHTAECMTRGDLVCTLEETEGHAHGENCSETVLVCDLTVEPHVHTEGCYTQLVCELPEDETHTHSGECSGVVLSCDLTEQPHVHGDGCYQTNWLCELPETAGHTHGDGCYAVVPGCGLEETEGHAHGDSCYEQLRELTCQPEESEPTEAPEPELICEEEVIKLHTHDEDDCYETWVDENGEEQKRLICEETVVEEHVHTDSCFVTEEVPLENVDTLTCGQEEGETHTHTDRCYGTWELVCGKEEHTHNEECTPEPETTYYCGKEAHTHTEECTDAEGNLICELEEHVHIERCALEMSVEDRAAVEAVEALIEPLPTYDDMMAKLDEFYEADDTEGEETYMMEVYAQVEEAYRAYMALDESLRGYVSNADKLMELEFIWSRVTLGTAPEITVSNGTISVPVTAVNSYDATEAVFKANIATIIHGNTAAELVAAGTFPTGADFYWHTAYIVETLGTSDGNEYFVNAVIKGEVAKDTYKAKTSGGFVLYILNDYAQNIDISRGDLIDPDFDFTLYSGKGVNTDSEYGHLVITDNSSSNQSVETVSAANINATVKILNYDDTINDQGLGPAGYNFYHGNYGYGPAVEHVNGVGHTNDNGSAAQGAIKYPQMRQELDANGYPQMEEGSVAYLFDGSATRADGTSTLQGTMTNGGGLFQRDSHGYYYYDSLLNAAYYNQSVNRFVLYDDLVVRPWYTTSTTDASRGNLLPFNKVTASNVTIDNALEADGLTKENADLVYGSAYVPDATTARMARLEEQVDLWFGMTVEFEFFMPKGGLVNGEPMVFDFHGDDDVWVYIGTWNEETSSYDYQLVLDIGGAHGARSGNINFATGEVNDFPPGSDSATANSAARERTLKDIFALSGDTFTDYSKLALKFFYMERGGNISYCRLRFNIPTLPDKSLTVTKELTSNDTTGEVEGFLADTLEYKFRVVKADENGEATDELFIRPGTTYTLLENGSEAGTGTVDAQGFFYLKADQSAQFAGMLEKGNGATQYIVEEIMPDDLTGQYGSVEYEVSGAGGSTKTDDGPSEDFTAYRTASLSAEQSQLVTYRNKVDISQLSILKLTKALADGAEFASGKTFNIQVELGGELLPVGTKYQVGTETREVTTAGIVTLAIGETATILDEILSGTEFDVTELGAETGGFTPSYFGTLTHKDNTSTDIACTANGASGEFTLNSVAHVTVTNANYDFAGQIPIYKQALDNSSTATFQFLVQQVEKNNWDQGTNLPGTSITVSDAAEHSGTITIGYEANTNATFYYKISERRGTDSYVYDDTFYIVEVNVSNQGANGQGTATVTGIWKNGTEEAEKILFINRRTTSLMVTKQVTGNVSGGGTFGFEATVTLKGQPFNLPQPTSGQYTVAGNKATFELGNGGAISIDGIPYNAVVVVSEVRHDGFTAYHRVDGIHTEDQLGETVTVNFASGTQTVRFVNVGGYELPETGGAGTTSYTMVGLLLMLMAAAISLYIQTIKRRKEEMSSF